MAIQTISAKIKINASSQGLATESTNIPDDIAIAYTAIRQQNI